MIDDKQICALAARRIKALTELADLPSYPQDEALVAALEAEGKHTAWLEQAVLNAEWCLSDKGEALRKDPRGDRRQLVFDMADVIRGRRAQG